MGDRKLSKQLSPTIKIKPGDHYVETRKIRIKGKGLTDMEIMNDSLPILNKSAGGNFFMVRGTETKSQTMIAKSVNTSDMPQMANKFKQYKTSHTNKDINFDYPDTNGHK